MRIKLTAAMIAAVAVSAVVCATAFVEYEGPVWMMKGSALTESLVVTVKSTSLKLEDTGTGAAVECHVTGEAKVGSEGKGEITHLETKECKNVKSCEEGTVLVTPLGTPWATQLANVGEEGEVRDTVKPTWVVECHVLGLLMKDECAGETSELVENATESTVNNIFNSKSAHIACSVGGAGAGALTGTDVDESSAENKLQMQDAYVTSLNAGNGVPLFNEAWCEYTAMGQECWIEFRNRANATVEIFEKEIGPPSASTRYGITTENCTLLLLLTVGAGCIDKVTLLVVPGTGWSNGYVVRARTAGGARGSGILNLLTP